MLIQGVAWDKLVMQGFLMVYHDPPTRDLIFLWKIKSGKNCIELNRIASRKNCIASVYVYTCAKERDESLCKMVT